MTFERSFLRFVLDHLVVGGAKDASDDIDVGSVLGEEEIYCDGVVVE